MKALTTNKASVRHRTDRQEVYARIHADLGNVTAQHWLCRHLSCTVTAHGPKLCFPLRLGRCLSATPGHQADPRRASYGSAYSQMLTVVSVKNLLPQAKKCSQGTFSGFRHASDAHRSLHSSPVSMLWHVAAITQASAPLKA